MHDASNSCSLAVSRQQLIAPALKAFASNQPNMLLLFETAAGFALFKVNNEDKLEKAEVTRRDLGIAAGLD
jgi:hypothetical protein